MPAGAAEGERLKSDYVLMLLQCILGVAVLMLPSILAKRFRLEIPSMMLILFVLFLYCAVYLGEVQDFYYKVSNWDTILHGFSGGMLGTLGFSVIALFNNSDRIPVNLSPISVSYTHLDVYKRQSPKKAGSSTSTMALRTIPGRSSSATTGKTRW